jgi:hypothetical protein
MPQVYVQERKESPLDTIMKGLTVASQVYGIKANMATIEEHKARMKQDEEDAPFNKKMQAAKLESLAAEKAARERPKYEQLPASENGVAGTGIFDFSTGQPRRVGFIPGRPEAAPKLERVEVVDDSGNKQVQFVQPTAGMMINAGKPADTAKPNKDQYDAATFGRRVESANSQLQELGKTYDRASFVEGAKAFILPEAAYSPQLRLQRQAERNFVNAVLRRESGAAISKSEFDSAEQQYFPRAGDTPEVLAQKEQNRMQVAEGLRAAAGNAWDKVQLIGKKEEAPKSESGTAQAAPMKSSLAIEALKIKAAAGDKDAQAFLKSLGGK